MAADWQNVRVRAHVMERLRERLRRQHEAYSAGHAGLQRGCPMSFSDLIEKALDHLDNDDRRKRESRARLASARWKSRHHVIAPNGGQQ